MKEVKPEQGLTLCRRYFKEVGRTAFENLRSENGIALFPRLAFGLVGEGSDSFGYDDTYSRDHDWGPAFCVWYDAEDSEVNPALLAETYAQLPQVFEGHERMQMPEAQGRVGVSTIQAFYQRLIGQSAVPETSIAWLNIPESALAVATNGEIFEDAYGKFSAIRAALLRFYPEDARLKKIAARLFSIGQSGQYNLPRCLDRTDWIAGRHALNEFVQNYMSLVHLMEYKYRPYYKWAARSMASLNGWQNELQLLNTLSTILLSDKTTIMENVDRLCTRVLRELQNAGLCDDSSDFLPHQAAVVQSKITEDRIRALPVQLG